MSFARRQRAMTLNIIIIFRKKGFQNTKAKGFQNTKAKGEGPIKYHLLVQRFSKHQGQGRRPYIIFFGTKVFKTQRPRAKTLNMYNMFFWHKSFQNTTAKGQGRRPYIILLGGEKLQKVSSRQPPISKATPNKCPTSNESSTRNPNHEPCTCKGRKSVSVGSVCVLGEPWLELLSSQTAAPTATATA